ncbi:MAG: homoserine kinase [Thaumarchaeota archaeon]|nr:homoserine kinase [Nitrososphaerota archaeon]
MKISSVVVKAPSSTANLGPGFDVFGLAIDAFYDEIKICRKNDSGVKIINVNKVLINKRNTATITIRCMKKEFGINDGVSIYLKKGVPIGFGMGSSAASAAAAAIGFNKLFKLNLDSNSLIKFAGLGEKASSGTIHYDNVAASILGGFVIVKNNPLNVFTVTPPQNLRLCLAIPEIKIADQKTKLARNVMPSKIKLKDSIYNLSNATQMVYGFMNNNIKTIGESMNDRIIEESRKKLIPGFLKVKTSAIKAGAFGASISGAGPTIIAVADKSSELKKICYAMKKSFNEENVKCNTIICKPSKGALK